MLATFIAHAGLAITEAGVTVLIDPWFTDSTREEPLIESLGGHTTIDFQLPPTRERLEAYTPAAILLSHFHAHHSPRGDITRIVEQTLSDITLAFPLDQFEPIVRKRLGHFGHLHLRAAAHRESFQVGPFTITPLKHTLPDHLAWSVKSATGHILHLADARANRDPQLKTLDSAWDDYLDLHPDVLLVSAGRNSYRTEHNGSRLILEATTLSPIQAATLAQLLGPKVVSGIGNHNHSIWKNRVEFIPEAIASEEELRWALSWLAPETRFVPIRAGHVFGLRLPVLPDPPIDTLIW